MPLPARIQGRHHRLRPRRLHRGDLRRAAPTWSPSCSRAAAPPSSRHHPGRPADDHHRGRELPRLPQGRSQGPELMELFKAQAERFGTQRRHRRRDRGRSLDRPFQRHLDRGRAGGRDADHRDRRVGQVAGHPVGGEVPELRRVGLRDLRRRALQGARADRRRRRRHGDGGGDLPDPLRAPRSRSSTAATSSAPRRSCSTARRATRRSSSSPTPSSRRSWASCRGRASPACACATRATDSTREMPAAACSSPSATSRTRSCSRACSTWTPPATSR